MTAEPDPSDVVARYQPRRGGGPLVLILGVIFFGFILYRGLSEPGRDLFATIAFGIVLVAGIGLVAVLSAVLGLRAVEVSPSGTIDFVTRIKRESFPRTALLRIEGQTTPTSRSHADWVRFIFNDVGQNEIEKKILAPRKDDPALQEFVRHLERLDPKLDASQFWAWSRG